MAITATLLGTTFVGWDNGPTGATNTVTSPSIAPGANCHLVAMLSVVGPSTTTFPNVPTSSGSGPNWTGSLVESTNASSSYNPASGIWAVAIGGSDPGSFTVSYVYNGGAAQFCIHLLSIYKITGHDTGTPTGGKETTQGQAGNGAVNITLDAAPATGDVTLAQCLVDENTTNKVSTFGTGTWTTDQDGAASGHQLAYNVGQRSASTSTTVPWSDVNSGTDNFGSTQAAVVIKAAAGGTDGTATPAAIAVVATVPQAEPDRAATATPAATAVGVTIPTATATGDAPAVVQRSIIRSSLRLA